MEVSSQLQQPSATSDGATSKCSISWMIGVFAGSFGEGEAHRGVSAKICARAARPYAWRLVALVSGVRSRLSMLSLLVPSWHICPCRPLVAVMLACLWGDAIAEDTLRTSICTPVGDWYGRVEGILRGPLMGINEDRSGLVEFGPIDGMECLEEVKVVNGAKGFSFAAREQHDRRCQGFRGNIQYSEDCESGTGTFVNGDGTGGQATWSRVPHLTVRRESLTGYRVEGIAYSDLDHLSYAAIKIGGAAGPRLEEAEESPRGSDVRHIKLVPHAAQGKPQPGGLARLRFRLDTIDGPVVDETKRAASFGMSCYMIAVETDYGAPPLSCESRRIRGVVYSGVASDPYGLPGQYCRSFIANVRLQGSARLHDGSFVHYEGNPERIFKIAVPQTADGTPLIPGRTVARDPRIVRGRNVAMSLDGIGDVLANDRGGGIKGYRIDLYKGEGEAACRGYPNPTLIGGCAAAQETCPGV